ncbi:MAG: hypothetical protein AB7K35_15265 [Pseudorhodoplanes sp.]
MIRTGLLAAIVILGSAAPAPAQYCAVYNDGSQTCGIPTFQSCLQSVSGVGGNCTPDDSAQLRPNLLQRMFGLNQDGEVPATRDPDPMPPPPSQN